MGWGGGARGLVGGGARVSDFFTKNPNIKIKVSFFLGGGGGNWGIGGGLEYFSWMGGGGGGGSIVGEGRGWSKCNFYKG